MQWTSEPPSKEGYYWHRDNSIASIESIFALGEAFHVSAAYRGPDGDESESVKSFGGEWCGPLVIPTDAKSLDDFIGLHEDVTIIYVVDGYEATLNAEDGRSVVATGRGETVAAASQDLRAKLNQGKPR